LPAEPACSCADALGPLDRYEHRDG
jgi:hypothetical protein